MRRPAITPSTPSAPLLAPVLGAAGAVLLMAFAMGVALWAFGGRMLRPALGLAGLVAGVPVGVWLGVQVAPEVPPPVFAALGAVAGVVLASLSYPLALAVVTASLLSCAGFMGAWTAADAGWLDPARASAFLESAPSAAVAGASGAATPERGGTSALLAAHAGAGRSLTELWMSQLGGADAPSTGAARAAHASEGSGSAGPDDAAAGGFGGAWARTRSAALQAWNDFPPPLRTWLMAAAAAGAAAGFLFGLLCQRAAAVMVTSLAGAAVMLVAGVPLLTALAGRTSDLMPSRPGAWLLGTLLLAIIGVGVQRWSATPREQPRAAPATA